MSETWDEKLSRVRSMASDNGQTWDLSPNDQAALSLVLGMLGVAFNDLSLARGTALEDEYNRVGEYVQRVQARRAG